MQRNPRKHLWTRRQFVQASAVGVVSGTAKPFWGCNGSAPRFWANFSLSRSSPNETIRVACIGVRGRGAQHMMGIEATPGAEVVALCDVDSAVLHARAEEFSLRTGRNVRCYDDYRRLLENPQIDAVTIATCNHTHALIACAALEAGKDVYVEKPCSHNIWEGEQLIKAVQKYGRICFHGMQSRTSPAIKEAIQHLHTGLIGRVIMARLECFGGSAVPGPNLQEPVPPGVNYDLWLGPAPVRPFNPNRFHFYWRWDPEYGNADLGNQAMHLVDLARWGLQVKWPRRIVPIWDPPRRKESVHPSALARAWFFDFRDEGKLLFLEFYPKSRVSSLRRSQKPFPEGIIFDGEDGSMEMGFFGYKTFLGNSMTPGPEGEAPSQEFERFIQAVRTRKMTDSDPDIVQGHCTSSLMHLALIASRFDRTIEWDPVAERIVGDEEAARLCIRNYRPPFVLPQVV